MDSNIDLTLDKAASNGAASELKLDPTTQLVTVNDESPTVSTLWDRAVQQAVINESPGPTIASRAYGILHTAMFDAWAAYDPSAIATQLGDDLQRSASENTVDNKTEAMSYAAYRVLTELFPEQGDIFDALMAELGFDPNDVTTEATSAAGIGNLSAEALMAFRRQDGSNQLGDDPNSSGTPYADNSGYTPFNDPGQSKDISRWTPELVPIDDESGTVQEFLTPQWGNVTPFGLDSGDQVRPEAPHPFLVEGLDAEVDLAAKTITLEDGTVLPITKDLVGSVINPEFVAQAERVIEASANLTDEQKLIAEFWEDGGGTSFPPATWMTFGQYVSARDNNSLDTDAQLFFALGNAVFDAGVATWEAKATYDYVRPVRAIRDLGELGLVGEFDPTLGGFAIDAWAGPGEGTQKILATDFLTYQTPGLDPSPPFAEYTSGHSAFSASGAEILKLFTGSDAFGGSVTFEPGQSRFEPNVTPEEPVSLNWQTFSNAADEAGLSRIYGGIHFDQGDLNGRTLGRQVGGSALNQALFFINGGEAVNSIVGDEQNNLLKGTEADDRIVALGGNDVVSGLQGNDQLLGGEGDDVIRGRIGQDTLSGGAGQDVLAGGRGRDHLFGDAGTDQLQGRAGNDVLKGGTGKDTLYGGMGRDYLDGGRGRDKLFGDAGNDRLRGRAGNDFLRGGTGKDTLYGGTGQDFLKGSRGSDFLEGGSGDDLLLGGKDRDQLRGDAGQDGFVLAQGDGTDIVLDYEVNTDFIGLLDSLTFEELSLSQQGKNVVLGVTETEETLAVLKNVSAEQLTETQFRSVADISDLKIS